MKLMRVLAHKDNTGYPMKKVPAGQVPGIEWPPLGLEFLGAA